MPLLHTSTATLEGTAYFEFLPGKYQNKCWNEASVFLDEEAFGYVEPIFERLVPDYDHYAFVEVQRPRWSPIRAELGRLLWLLNAAPSDGDLSENIGFRFRDTQEKFFAGRPQTIEDVRVMIVDLDTWLERILRDHESVSLLGL